MPTQASPDSKLTRIGIFYDGNYFSHVSNYYLYHHDRRARISIAGLHSFIRDKVGECEAVDSRYCTIVDAHYFRGRLPTKHAEDQNRLRGDRIFDEILMRENIVTHYLPTTPKGEKGIDVWLALEAFELAIYKRFSVSVIIAGDGDFLPLIRKLNTLGTRVMILGWDFKYIDENDSERETKTSQQLLDEATYPILMSNIVDDRTNKTNSLVNSLFMPKSNNTAKARRSNPASTIGSPESTNESGTIRELKNGFGFITSAAGGNGIFFFHADLVDLDFNDLQIGDTVTYSLGKNEKGPCAKEVRVGK